MSYREAKTKYNDKPGPLCREGRELLEGYLKKWNTNALVNRLEELRCIPREKRTKTDKAEITIIRRLVRIPNRSLEI